MKADTRLLGGDVPEKGHAGRNKRKPKAALAAGAVFLSGALGFSGLALSSLSGQPIRAGASEGNEIVLVSPEEETDVQEITADDFLGYFTEGQEIILEPVEETAKEEIIEEEPAGEEAAEGTENLLVAGVDGQINVRREPDDDAEIVGVLYQDCAGELISEEGDWVQLVSGDVTGWARRGGFLFGEEAEEKAKETGTLTATVNASSLYLRSEPDSGAETLGTIEGGEEVAVLSEDTDGDNWVEVEAEGKTGYINTQYADIGLSFLSGDTMDAYYERLEAEISARSSSKGTGVSVTRMGTYEGTADDLTLLAAIIYCEAGGEPYEGKVAVGNVVLNRVKSVAFPDTVEAVIRSPGQFSPVASGRFDRILTSGRIPESCYQAAEDAMNGISYVNVCLFFKNPHIAGAHAGITIGNHVFW